MKYLIAALFALVFSLLAAVCIAQTFCKCVTRCHVDSGGHTICKTECRGDCR